jgi:sterol 14-demethylase
MRKAMSDFSYKGWTVPAGHLVAASPAVSNRMPEHFPDPEQYAPERYLPDREEDRQSFAWIPFGAGRHRCVGAAFAMMQLKAIFSILLRNWELELSQPPESYANDHSKMVVAVKQPCRARFRRRRVATSPTAERAGPDARAAAAEAPLRIRIDTDLCQGHAVCMGEAPEVFDVERNEDGEDKVVLRMQRPTPALRAKVEAAVRHCPTRALAIEE